MTPTDAERPHRGTIFEEAARILDHQDAGAGQWILRVQAPECAQRAAPGQFAHIQCSPNLPMRRPLSIQRVDREAGWVEFLYKVVGDGTRALSQQPVGDFLSVLGPIGVPFRLNPERPLRLLLGGGVGIPPMIFLADHLRRQDEAGQTRAILGSEVPFPFRAKPSEILWPGLPDGAIATLPLLEDWGVACRLTSKAGIPGAHDGFVTDLARPGSTRSRPRNVTRSSSTPAARTRCSRPARNWQRSSTCLVRFLWRNSWPVRWVAAPAARYRCARPTGSR